ncbi:MAG: hypothetical protein HY594_04680 [Candidatus Omnitrophica bacterium]|nr:hypothetical protein [Candidatus Omnitrophota bacterium]
MALPVLTVHVPAAAAALHGRAPAVWGPMAPEVALVWPAEQERPVRQEKFVLEQRPGLSPD